MPPCFWRLSQLTAKSVSQRLALLALVLLCWIVAGTGLVHAQNSSPTSAFSLPSLFADSQRLPLQEPLRVRVAQMGQTVTVSELAALPADQWTIWQPATVLPTSAQQQVWLRLALPMEATPQTWMLRIPRPSMDTLTLYSNLVGNAQWTSQSAGQTVPSQSWPLRSRDPVFSLSTRSDQTQLFFIRVDNTVPVTENIQLIHHSDFADGANRVGTLNGLIIGIFCLMTLLSLVSAKVNRSDHFAWFALFAFTVMLAQLTVTGYMMIRIWPGSVYLNKTMGWVMPLLALASLARYALAVSYAKDLSRPIYWTLWTIIICSLLAVGGILLMPYDFPRYALNALFAVSLLAILICLSVIAWRSQHWLWLVVASMVPVVLSVMARLAYNIGWVSHVELALLAGVVTAAIGMLLTYTAMILHQRQRTTGVLRQDALESHDGATGLYNERIAMARLPQIILRSKRFGKPCAAMMVRWIDFDKTMEASTTTERGRVFAHLGNRLSRLARDIDTVARVGDDMFIFLVEAPVTREQISQLASHVLTTCLRPSPAMPDQQGFNLHIALWLSDVVSADAKQVLELLKTRINQMREGTQRRVQFIDTPLSTGPISEEQQAQHAKQLLEKINSLEATHGLPTIALKNRPQSVPPKS